MPSKKILLLGGSGFVGSALAPALVRAGHRVTVPSRRPERARHLLPLPTLSLCAADIHDPAALRQLLASHDVVINLVGILHGGRPGLPVSPQFARAHVELPQQLVAACRATGVHRLLQVSALGADPAGPSGYLASKAAGEAAVLAAAAEIAVTLFRPSVIFGAGDAFLNTFARLQQLAPVIPLAGANARLQPVHVGDVAAAIVAALDDPRSFGQTYELCGPEVFTLRELVELSGELAGNPRPVVPLCPRAAGLLAHLSELLPAPLLSRDNLLSLRVDNVCQGQCAAPPGWSPQSLRQLAPAFLSNGDQRRADDWRRVAGR